MGSILLNINAAGYLCGSNLSYGGGQSFPSEYVVQVGSTPGTISFYGSAGNNPDKFMVYDGDTLLYNSGYLSDDPPTYQPYLDAALTSKGLPLETITSPGSITINIVKSSTNPFLTVKVYSPLPGTVWNFRVGCPT